MISDAIRVAAATFAVGFVGPTVGRSRPHGVWAISKDLSCFADLGPDGLAFTRVFGAAGVAVGDRAVGLVHVGLAGLAGAVSWSVAVDVLADAGVEARRLRRAWAVRPGWTAGAAVGMVLAGAVRALVARQVVADALLEAACLTVAGLSWAVAAGVSLRTGWVIRTLRAPAMQFGHQVPGRSGVALTPPRPVLGVSEPVVGFGPRPSPIAARIASFVAGFRSILVGPADTGQGAGR